MEKTMASCLNCGEFDDAETRFCRCCGAPLFAVTAPGPPEWVGALDKGVALAGPSAVVRPRDLEPPPKSIALAVLLAALFGPAGMVYSTLTGAIIMLAISVSLLLASGDDFFQENLYSLPIVWSICVAWSAIAAETWNEERR